MPPKAEKRKPRGVVDTSVLVAGILGFREPFLAGKNPSADVPHMWAEEVKARSTVEISLDPKDDPFCLCSEQGNADFIVTLNPKDFPEDWLKAKVVPPGHFLT